MNYCWASQKSQKAHGYTSGKLNFSMLHSVFNGASLFLKVIAIVFDEVWRLLQKAMFFVQNFEKEIIIWEWSLIFFSKRAVWVVEAILYPYILLYSLCNSYTLVFVEVLFLVTKIKSPIFVSTILIFFLHNRSLARQPNL